MSPKRTGRKRIGADRIRRTDWRSLLRRGEFTAFNLLTTGAYLFMLGAVIYVGLTSANLLIMAMASVVLFVMVASVAPLDRIGDFSGWLFSSQSAEDLQAMAESWLPGRGRGQLTPLQGLVFALLVVAATVGTLSISAAVVMGQEDPGPGNQCQVDVVHDAFRTDNATIQTLNDTGSASSVTENTRVTVEESTGFYRVIAENPNGYCVDLEVQIHETIIPPAELGTISSNGTVEATWSDVHDFDTQTSYTTVVLSVPAGETVRIAPNKPTVMLPAWRDAHKREAESLLGRALDLNPFAEEGDLEERIYTISPSETNGTTVTIPLTNKNETREIEEWNAVYRTSEDEAWRPVDTDLDQAVAYRHIDDRSKVQFVFNEGAEDYNGNLAVEFTANPTRRDELKFSFRSLKRSMADAIDVPFLMVQPSVSAFGGVPW